MVRLTSGWRCRWTVGNECVHRGLFLYEATRVSQERQVVSLSPHFGGNKVYETLGDQIPRASISACVLQGTSPANSLASMRSTLVMCASSMQINAGMIQDMATAQSLSNTIDGVL